MNLPIIGITMGGPARIGTEIAIKALFDEKVRSICRPVIIGDAATLDYTAEHLKWKARIHPVTKISEAVFPPGMNGILHMAAVDLDQPKWGEISAMAGHAAFEAVRKVIELAM